MRRAWVIAVAIAGCASPPSQDSRSPQEELEVLAREARSLKDSVIREGTLKEVATVQAQVGDFEGSKSTLSAIPDWSERFPACMGIILHAGQLKRGVALDLLALARETLEPAADPDTDGSRDRSFYKPLAIGYAKWNQDREALWALGKVGSSIRDWVVTAQAICQEQVWGGRAEAAIALAESANAFEPEELFEVIALALAKVGRPWEGLKLADRAGEQKDWVRFRCLLKIPDFATATPMVEQLKDWQIDARVELAKAYASLGNNEEAWKQLQEACDEALFRQEQLEYCWMARAEFRFSIGDLEGAVEAVESNFLDALERNRALREFGRRLIAQGRLDRAAELIPRIGNHFTAMRLGDLALAKWKQGEGEEARTLILRAVERYERFLATRTPPFEASTMASENPWSPSGDLAELLGRLGTIDPKLLVDGLPRWKDHLEEPQLCEAYRQMGRNRPDGVAPLKLTDLPLDRRIHLKLGMMEARLRLVP